VTPRGQANAVDVVIVGGGHCGLAMSRALSQRGIAHVVLERGEVANAWRAERWDSLRLLTPNWMTRLPGLAYDGADPDGYMTAPEVAGFLSRYAAMVAAPLRAATTVLGARPTGNGWCVETTQGDWQCRALVIATGAAGRPVVPTAAADVPGEITQFTALDYRRPAQLPDGGVLIVGASATGLQLAQEIQRSGRPVTLAVGEHVRMPRLHRGRDIQWWLLAAGVLDQRREDVDDVTRVRRLPSPQLIGTPERAALDLNVLQRGGVRVVGRLAQVRDGRALFSGSLRNVCALADLKMNRLLDTLDDWALGAGLGQDVDAAEPRPAITRLPDTATTALDLKRHFRSVIWATGMRPDHAWLDAALRDRAGTLRHDGGVAELPGLYVLGLPFLRRRKSSYIHGAGQDVDELVPHLAAHLNRAARARGAARGIAR
jgi:putative flavoprotein involved in K+ transport